MARAAVVLAVELEVGFKRRPRRPHLRAGIGHMGCNSGKSDNYWLALSSVVRIGCMRYSRLPCGVWPPDLALLSRCECVAL